MRFEFSFNIVFSKNSYKIYIRFEIYFHIDLNVPKFSSCLFFIHTNFRFKKLTELFYLIETRVILLKKKKQENLYPIYFI